MSLDAIEQLRELLTGFVPAEIGRAIRKILHEEALCEYVPQHSPSEYLKFMNANPCSFDINGSQSTNHPYYMTLFTEVSQHVMGDCVEHCLDNAMSVAGRVE